MRLSVKFLIPLASLVLTSCGSGPTGVAERFAKAAEAGHSGEALQYVDPMIRELAGEKLGAAMAANEGKTSAHGGLKTVTATETKRDGDYATVHVMEKFGDGSSSENEVKMRHVDGKWYVTM